MELKLVISLAFGTRRRLLIVPYGIETRITDVTVAAIRCPFNRTLWN